MIIQVSGLTKRFKNSWALAGVDFSVNAGEIFGFVGPNGAGKTTTMRVLTGLLRPTSGSVTLDGIDVLAHPMPARERVGFMPDFFGVYDQFTAAEYLGFYASCYGIPRTRLRSITTDLLDLVNLGDKRDQMVDTLSRGMKQRLCLARTLVHDPPVLVLDEPASGLDPGARYEMRELLLELRDMGKTILISSHILPELAEMCTTFGILHGGRMVATGKLDELLKTGEQRKIAVRVSGDASQWLDAARSVAGVLGAEAGTSGIDLTFSGDDAEAAAILRGMIAAHVPVISFTPVEHNLEDLFLTLTTGTEGVA